MDYLVYTDESHITNSRYQSISSVSFPLTNQKHLEDCITENLITSGIVEFKWKKLKDAKYYFAAEKIVNSVFNNLFECNIRVDTLVWDTQDSRNTVQGRDDIANFERMFFHLLSASMKKRELKANWHIRPDERNGINWDTINKCLNSVGRKQKLQQTIFGIFLSDPHYHVSSFKAVDSKEEKIVQIADLFAGLAVFSHTNYSEYSFWCNEKAPTLFENAENEKNLSNSVQYRCRLLNLFNFKCKSMKLGVSLRNRKCLNTFDHSNSINFWNYEVQGDYDKAPVKAPRE